MRDIRSSSIVRAGKFTLAIYLTIADFFGRTTSLISMNFCRVFLRVQTFGIEGAG